MLEPRYKTMSWKQYNQALINRGSLTFWIDEGAIAEWKQNNQGKRGRPRRFNDLAIDANALKVNGRSRSMVLTESVRFGVSFILQ